MCKKALFAGKSRAAWSAAERRTVPSYGGSAGDAAGAGAGIRPDQNRCRRCFAKAAPGGGQLYALLSGWCQCRDCLCSGAWHSADLHHPSAGARCGGTVCRKGRGAVLPKGTAVPYLRRHHGSFAVRSGAYHYHPWHQYGSVRRSGGGPRRRAAGLWLPRRCRGLASCRAVHGRNSPQVQRKGAAMQSFRAGKPVQCPACCRKSTGIRLQVLPALRGGYRCPHDKSCAEGIPRLAGGLCRRRNEQRYHPHMGAAASAAGLFCAGAVFQR